MTYNSSCRFENINSDCYMDDFGVIRMKKEKNEIVPAVKRRRKGESGKNIPAGIKLVFFVTAFLIVLALFALIFFSVMRWSGKNKLYAKGTDAPDIGYVEETGGQQETQEETEITTQDGESVYVYQEGDVSYNGHMYRYNKDMLTFLILGIDSNDPVPEVNENTNYLMGGQSDAIFLFAMNPHDRTLSVIAVNRNTMTDIDMYDENNNYVRTAKAQLCVQHGYGDGGVQSCERAKEKVSELLYNLPIHGYVSMRLGAIWVLNDAVGGVEVTLPFDVPEINQGAGATVRLYGQDAFYFLKYRSLDEFDSASARLEKDKIYLKAFMNQVFESTKSDIAYPIKLYDMVSNYIVTDISVNEMSYLASELLGYDVSGVRMYSVPGETIMGSKFEEFYVNEMQLKELLLDVFYEMVN